MRAPRERDGHASRQDVQDCQSPMGAASVPGTPVNGRYMRYGVFVLTINGRRTGAPHGTLLASPRAAAPRWYMLYLRRYCRLPLRRGLPRYIARVYGAHHPQMGVVTCVEIKILRRVRAESSRRPPRHRRDARSMAWQCGLSPLDSAGTAAFSPRKGFDID